MLGYSRLRIGEMRPNVITSRQGLYVKIEVVFAFFTLEDRNNAGLTTVFVPKDCQVVRTGVRRRIGKDDGRLGEKLWELIIPRQNNNSKALSFVEFLSLSEK